MFLGVPDQEKGIRPARALPYELNVRGSVNGGSVALTFVNTGRAAAVFQTRSANASDNVRNYTVEPGKKLTGSWNVGAGAAILDVHSRYRVEGRGWVLDAYTEERVSRHMEPGESLEHEWRIGEFHNWYDLVISVAEDTSFNYRLAGHVETGRESFSGPVLGGLVTLKA